jgi:hypothetical protein
VNRTGFFGGWGASLKLGIPERRLLDEKEQKQPSNHGGLNWRQSP